MAAGPPYSQPQSAKPLPDEHHELLLALVDLLQVVDELCELDVSVMCHEEGLACLAQELDELSVVPRADVCEA